MSNDEKNHVYNVTDLRDDSNRLKEFVKQNKDKLVVGALVVLFLRQQGTAKDVRSLTKVTRELASLNEELASTTVEIASEVHKIHGRLWQVNQILGQHTASITNQAEAMTKLTQRLGLFDTLFGSKIS